jgi:hypothetical protein
LVTYANGAVTPVDTLSVQAAKAQHFAAKAVAAPYYGYYGAHLIGKREAEAEAKPYLGYYGYPYATTYGAYPYASYGYPYTYTHLIGKREAEAEPEADAQFLYGTPYVYANPHTSLGLTSYFNGAVTPTKTLAVQAAEAQHFAAKAVTAPYYGYYGAHLIGKREAEAEAKPYVYGYGAYGYPYATTYGTYGAYGYPYAAYPYYG